VQNYKIKETFKSNMCAVLFFFVLFYACTTVGVSV